MEQKNDRIEKYLEGFARFKQKYYTEEPELFDKLKKGQSPDALVITCSDSRIDPLFLTEAKPGDLFVVRNIASIAPPYSDEEKSCVVMSASRYAVMHLNVPNIIVLGHSSCGGIGALVSMKSGDKVDPAIASWVKNIWEALAEAMEMNDELEDLQRVTEQRAVVCSMRNLLTYPWVKEKVENGQLQIHGWYFDMEDGSLHAYDKTVDRFDKVGS